MQIRATIAATDTIIDLTQTNGRAQVTAPDSGEITLLITDEDTAALNFTSGVYDLEIEYADGTVDRVLYGKVALSKEVTR